MDATAVKRQSDLRDHLQLLNDTERLVNELNNLQAENEASEREVPC